MTSNDVERLADLLEKFVDDDDDMTWTEKRDFIMANISDSGRVNLLEFVAWFTEDEGGGQAA